MTHPPPHDARAELIARAEELVKTHMAQYDPSHDWAHVNRVRNTALRIGRSLDPLPDMLVVELAALFHDMADAKYGPTSSLPTILSPFLSHPSTISLLTPPQISLINQIIPSVSWSTEKKLRASGGWDEWHETCVELHAVQDADRLDAVGAVGVMRCAAYSGAKGRVLLDVDNQQGESAEGHFHEKLLRIKDRMKTDFGKEEAERRHITMLAFLDALKQERKVWSE